MKIAIFGQYKSGTTALLYKIKNSLPGDTLMLNEPYEYKCTPQDDNCHVLAKVIAGVVNGREEARYENFLPFDKKIYIVRDPRDWVISGLMFLVQQQKEIYAHDDKVQAVLNLLRKKEKDPESVMVIEILEKILSYIPGQSLEVLREWMIEQYAWLFEFEKRLGDYYTIRYEDFIDGEYGGLEKYLGFSLAGEAKVDNENRHVIRTKGYGDWKNWFTPQDIKFFRPIFRDYMEYYGYGDNWELNHKRIINPEFSSRYVLRTVELRRKRSGLFNKLNNLMSRIWN